jgi:predicted RecA/RadA family phage recombinase
MKNFYCSGNAIDVVLAAAILSGAPILIGTLVGIATKDGAIGDTISVNLTGVFNLTKVTPQAISQGVQLYWDDTAKKVTTSDGTGANSKIGHAYAAALSADTTVYVRLER